MESIYKLDNIDAAAKDFVKLLQNHTVVAFHGNMGAGKTTFIKAICKVLMVNENISSPTFSIINQYKTAKDKIIFHLDLYRLRDMEEAINAGVEDCVYSGETCFIEWPEKIFSLLPDDTLQVFIEAVDETTRRLVVNLHTKN